MLYVPSPPPPFGSANAASFRDSSLHRHFPFPISFHVRLFPFSTIFPFRFPDNPIPCIFLGHSFLCFPVNRLSLSVSRSTPNFILPFSPIRRSAHTQTRAPLLQIRPNDVMPKCLTTVLVSLHKLAISVVLKIGHSIYLDKNRVKRQRTKLCTIIQNECMIDRLMSKDVCRERSRPTRIQDFTNE